MYVTADEKSISQGFDVHLLQHPSPPFIVHTLLLAVQPPTGHTSDRKTLSPAPSQKYSSPHAAVVHDANDVLDSSVTQVPTGHAVLIPLLQ